MKSLFDAAVVAGGLIAKELALGPRKEEDTDVEDDPAVLGARQKRNDLFYHAMYVGVKVSRAFIFYNLKRFGNSRIL